jgi:hypothetical protein
VLFVWCLLSRGVQAKHHESFLGKVNLKGDRKCTFKQKIAPAPFLVFGVSCYEEFKRGALKKKMKGLDIWQVPG